MFVETGPTPMNALSLRLPSSMELDESPLVAADGSSPNGCCPPLVPESSDSPNPSNKDDHSNSRLIASPDKPSDFAFNSAQYAKLDRWGCDPVLGPISLITYTDSSRVLKNFTNTSLVHKTFVVESVSSMSARELHFSHIAQVSHYYVLESCFRYLPSHDGVINQEKHITVRNWPLVEPNAAISQDVDETLKKSASEAKRIEEDFLFATLQLVVPVAFVVNEQRARGRGPKPAIPIVTTTGIWMKSYTRSLNLMVSRDQSSVNHTPFVHGTEAYDVDDEHRCDTPASDDAEGDDILTDEKNEILVYDQDDGDVEGDRDLPLPSNELKNDATLTFAEGGLNSNVEDVKIVQMEAPPNLSPSINEAEQQQDEQQQTHKQMPARVDSTNILADRGSSSTFSTYHFDPQSSQFFVDGSHPSVRMPTIEELKNSSELSLATPASFLYDTTATRTPTNRGPAHVMFAPNGTADSFDGNGCPPPFNKMLASAAAAANQHRIYAAQFDMPPRNSINTPCYTPLHGQSMSEDFSVTSAPTDYSNYRGQNFVSGSLNSSVSVNNSPAVAQRLLAMAGGHSTPQSRLRGPLLSSDESGMQSNEDEKKFEIGGSFCQQLTDTMTATDSANNCREDSFKSPSPQQGCIPRQLSTAMTYTNPNSATNRSGETNTTSTTKKPGQLLSATAAVLRHAKSANDVCLTALEEASRKRQHRERVRDRFRRGERNEPIKDKRLLVAIIFLIVRGLKQLHLQHHHTVTMLVLPAADKTKGTAHPLYFKGVYIIDLAKFEAYTTREGMQPLAPVKESPDPAKPGSLYNVPFSGFCHNDLRLANIVADSTNGNLLLCDFELAEFVAGESDTLLELINDEPKKQMNLSCKTNFDGMRVSKDGYALGVLIAELITGKEPLFADERHSELSAEDILDYLTDRQSKILLSKETEKSQVTNPSSVTPPTETAKLKANHNRIANEKLEAFFCKDLKDLLLGCFDRDPQTRWKVTLKAEFHPLFTTVLGSAATGSAAQPSAPISGASEEKEFSTFSTLPDVNSLQNTVTRAMQETGTFYSSPPVSGGPTTSNLLNQSQLKQRVMDHLGPRSLWCKECQSAFDDDSTNWIALERAQRLVSKWLRHQK